MIGFASILPALFDRIILPSTVKYELISAPPTVHDWLLSNPPWIEIRQPSSEFCISKNLHAGEEAAIALAFELRAELLLMDDRRGVLLARRNGLEVTGTLGVLARAAAENLLDLADDFALLRQTNFHCRQELMDALLTKTAR